MVFVFFFDFNKTVWSWNCKLWNYSRCIHVNIHFDNWFYFENWSLLIIKTFWLKYKLFPIIKVTFGLCWTYQSVGYFGPNGVEKFTFSVVQTKLLIKKFQNIISPRENSVYSKYLFFETVLSNILWFKVERNFFVISIVIRIHQTNVNF